MNIKLLNQIKKRIKERPLQFAMGDFFTDETDLCKKPSHCGTAACIGGWAIALSKRQRPGKVNEDLGEGLYKWVFPGDMAAKALDLSESQADRLFHTCDWPKKFRKAYEKILFQHSHGDLEDRAKLDYKKLHQQLVNVTIARINHFIKTKGRS